LNTEGGLGIKNLNKEEGIRNLKKERNLGIGKLNKEGGPGNKTFE
jgi:hypothetical protein